MGDEDDGECDLTTWGPGGGGEPGRAGLRTRRGRRPAQRQKLRSAEREGPRGGALWKVARSEGVSSGEKSRLTISAGTARKWTENNAVGVDGTPREQGRPAERVPGGVFGRGKGP